jgi:hypothetical protein
VAVEVPDVPVLTEATVVIKDQLPDRCLYQGDQKMETKACNTVNKTQTSRRKVFTQKPHRKYFRNTVNVQ